MNERFAGHLKLECGTDRHGRTYIKSQSIKVPFHISKPYWDGNVLNIQVINPTAGLFSGDVLESELTVNQGAKVLITTPSATRVHSSRGGVASVQQRFNISPGGWLEYSPSMLMPQFGSRYCQVSDMKIAVGGELYFMEILAPGRAARGEYFVFENLDWTCNVRYGAELILRERFQLNARNGSLFAFQSPIKNAWFASGMVISHRLGSQENLLSRIRSLNEDQVRVGISPLNDDCWTVRLLASNGLLLRKTIALLRTHLSEILPELNTQCRGL